MGYLMMWISNQKLGTDEQQRNVTITEVIKKLNDVEVLGHDGDVIGDAYEFLISQFASEAGKKAGEFYTPHMVSDMMAQIVTLDQKNDDSLVSLTQPWVQVP